MFVACNYLACTDEYQPRLEALLRSRSRVIDNVEGFMGLKVLKPVKGLDHLLIVSQWHDGEAFDAWRYSEGFKLMHARGFKDLREMADRDERPPVRSTFRTYDLIGI
jgi:heme-degrading monooxygenase HmoA